MFTLQLNLSKATSLKKQKKMVFKTYYCIMQVKSIAECSKGTVIKLPFVIKIYVLSIFELKTGFTVYELLISSQSISSQSSGPVVVHFHLSIWNHLADEK